MCKFIQTNNAPAAIGPYVQGVKSDTFVFTSGQLPIDPKNGKMPEDIAAQTLQSLLNIKAIIEQAGLTIGHIIKVTIFVKDLNNFTKINTVYEQFLIDHNHPAFPARSCVEVARLPKDAGIEIEAIAVSH